jgi:hypothetical protein
MREMPNLLKRLPVWLSLLIGLLLVGAIGYVDYLTGDYSMLIFYTIPIAMVAWIMQDRGAIIISVAAGLARYISDYHIYSSSNIRKWNSLEDTLFLLIVGLLISAVKRLIDNENENKQNK